MPLFLLGQNGEVSRVWAIVLAGGAGTRFGEVPIGTPPVGVIPDGVAPAGATKVPAGATKVPAGATKVPAGATKVTVLVAGRSMIAWSVEAARAACDGVTLVVPAQMIDQQANTSLQYDLGAGDLGTDLSVDLGADTVVAGGATRSGSVRSGLATVPADVDVVVCHDAARPGASAALFGAVIAAVRGGADAAVPALPVCDTLKQVSTWGESGGAVAATVNRTGLFAIATPQAFRPEALAAAHVGEPEATDDAALVEALGGTVVAVPGEAAAHKVTVPEDLVIVEALLRERIRDHIADS